MKAYVVPFAAYLVLMGAADLALPASLKYWLSPVQIVVCGALLIRYWLFYGLSLPKMTGLTLFIAIIVLLIWISPQEIFGQPRRYTDGFDPTPLKDRHGLYIAVLIMRFARLVVIVPLIEEIFWRGFLLRYLIRDDFSSLPFGTLTRNSFMIVTIAFCMEHKFPDWPAGLLAGALYNLLAWRTRSLGSCVLAHSVTNLLLGIYLVNTSQWGFW